MKIKYKCFHYKNTVIFQLLELDDIVSSKNRASHEYIHLSVKKGLIFEDFPDNISFRENTFNSPGKEYLVYYLHFLTSNRKINKQPSYVTLADESDAEKMIDAINIVLSNAFQSPVVSLGNMEYSL